MAIPQAREDVALPRHGVVAAGGVLDQYADVGLHDLERPLPASDALLDVVVCVSCVDDDCCRVDGLRRCRSVSCRFLRDGMRMLLFGDATLMR